jgi:peptidoglycan/LPS O-acetylase OafA/YrhL
VAPLAIYVLTPFRLDTLAFGALIAVFAADPARWPRFARAARRLLPVAALALVALCAWLMESPARGPAGGHRALLARPEMQTAGYSAFALFFACLLVRTLAPGGAETAFDRVVRTGALVGLGRVSYGVYLFHNPAIALTRRWIFDPAAVEWGFLPELGMTYVLAGGVTLAAALVSWRWLESPALRLRARFPYA